MKLGKWEHEANVAVDTGCILVGDPCYLGEPLKQLGDRIRDGEIESFPLSERDTDGLAATVLQAGSGDGTYPLLVRRIAEGDGKGWIAEMKICFFPGEPVEEPEEQGSGPRQDDGASCEVELVELLPPGPRGAPHGRTVGSWVLDPRKTEQLQRYGNIRLDEGGSAVTVVALPCDNNSTVWVRPGTDGMPVEVRVVFEDCISPDDLPLAGTVECMADGRL